MANTVDSVMHQETRRFNARNKTDPVVIQEMKAIVDAEEAAYRRDRVEFRRKCGILEKRIASERNSHAHLLN